MHSKNYLASIGRWIRVPHPCKIKIIHEKAYLPHARLREKQSVAPARLPILCNFLCVKQELFAEAHLKKRYVYAYVCVHVFFVGTLEGAPSCFLP